MRSKITVLGVLIFVLAFAAQAQKVKVGYDKSVDFSKYRTYSWVSDNSTELTLRRAAIMAEIDYALKQRGLEVVDEGGDLLLAATGSIGGEIGGQHQDAIRPVPADFYYPTATMWSGAPAAAGNYVISGTLVLDFIDRSTKTLVWQGSVSEKMDTEKHTKNTERVRKAIAKLVERYPPKK
ncbi:MAG: DUF4136 domain-containing protein [Terriglobia bacterium]|nr:DUF4136 domain-containing protein [Terriglobia bacterium]